MSCGASCCARCSDSAATTPDADIVERVRNEVATRAPDLAPWLPLLATAFDVEIAPTPEVDMLAENNRRTKLHETVARFLETMMPDKLLDRDRGRAPHGRGLGRAAVAPDRVGSPRGPWLFAVARRASAHRIRGARGAEVVRVELKPLAPQDALRLAQLAAEQESAPGARSRSRRRIDPGAIRSSCATCCARRSNPAASRDLPESGGSGR